MKNIIIILLILMSLVSCATTGNERNGAGASGISYPENTTPLETDQMLGIDDPAGTWAIQRFGLSAIQVLFQGLGWTFTNDVDLRTATSVLMGPNSYTASVDPPDEEGLYHYQSGITGFDASMLTHYSNGGVQVPVELPISELPTLLGDYPAYNPTTNQYEIFPAGSLSITEQSGDPAFSGMSTGDLIVATGSGDMFYKSATGGYTIPGTYTVDVVIPTMTSATIPTTGATVSLLFSEAITIGSGGNGGWTLNTPTDAMTYSSGDTTDTLIYTLASTINSTDTPTITYTQPGDGLENATGGDLASIVAAAVVNNSAQTPSASLFDWDATTFTATTSGADITASVNGPPVLSIEQYNSAPTSMKADTGNFRATFTRADIFNTTTCTGEIYFYGNYDDGKNTAFAQFFGDNSNYFQLGSITGNIIQLRAVLTGVSTYVSSGTTLNSAAWNKIVFTHTQTGSNTALTISVNDGAEGTANPANIWDAIVPYDSTKIGLINSTSPTTALYIDDVKVY